MNGTVEHLLLLRSQFENFSLKGRLEDRVGERIDRQRRGRILSSPATPGVSRSRVVAEGTVTSVSFISENSVVETETSVVLLRAAVILLGVAVAAIRNSIHLLINLLLCLYWANRSGKVRSRPELISKSSQVPELLRLNVH